MAIELLCLTTKRYLCLSLNLSQTVLVRRFPEMGVPPVIIHFHSSILNHPAIGVAHDYGPSIRWFFTPQSPLTSFPENAPLAGRAQIILSHLTAWGNQEFSEKNRMLCRGSAEFKTRNFHELSRPISGWWLTYVWNSQMFQTTNQHIFCLWLRRIQRALHLPSQFWSTCWKLSWATGPLVSQLVI